MIMKAETARSPCAQLCVWRGRGGGNHYGQPL